MTCWPQFTRLFKCKCTSRRKRSSKRGSPTATGDANAEDEHANQGFTLISSNPPKQDALVQQSSNPTSSTPANQEYKYEPLKSNQHIRLLRVTRLDSRLHSPSFSFEIVQVELAPPLLPAHVAVEQPYECLSYVWGGTERTETLQLVPSQGYIRITQTLQEVIDRLCEETKTGALWIDQICINQDDVNERGHQVRRMREIYSNATRTIVWLGHEIPNVDKAIQNITRPHGISWSLRSPHSEALKTLFRRPWFERGWVVQEYALNDAHVLVGPYSMDAQTLEHAAEAFAKLPSIKGGPLEQGMNPEGALRSPPPKGHSLFATIAEIRRRHNEDDRHFSLRESLRCLQVCGQTFSTSDPKDRLCAYLGLFPRLTYEPDYRYRLEVMLEMFARHVIRSTCTLQILPYASGSSRDHSDERSLPSLPSWVPHWRWPTDGSSLKYNPPEFTDPAEWPSSFSWEQYGSVRLDWSACKRYKHEYHEHSKDAPERLTVQGEQVDIIEWASQPIETRWKTVLIEPHLSTTFGIPDDDSAIQAIVTIWECLRLPAEPILEIVPMLLPFPGMARKQQQWKAKLDFACRYPTVAGKLVSESALIQRLESLKGAYVVGTKKGRFGVCTKPCAQGDMVMILNGCSQPMILRHARQSTMFMEVVSGCFLDGIMQGEAVNWKEDEADMFFLL